MMNQNLHALVVALAPCFQRWSELTNFKTGMPCKNNHGKLDKRSFELGLEKLGKRGNQIELDKPECNTAVTCEEKLI